MGQVKAKALTTLAGSYGRAVTGDEITLNDKHANQLEERGLIEIIGEAPDEDEAPKSKGVRFTDNTGKPAAKAEAETDPEDPTGEAKAAGKATAPGQKVAAEKKAVNVTKKAAKSKK